MLTFAGTLVAVRITAPMAGRWNDELFPSLLFLACRLRPLENASSRTKSKPLKSGTQVRAHTLASSVLSVVFLFTLPFPLLPSLLS